MAKLVAGMFASNFHSIVTQIVIPEAGPSPRFLAQRNSISVHYYRTYFEKDENKLTRLVRTVLSKAVASVHEPNPP